MIHWPLWLGHLGHLKKIQDSRFPFLLWVIGKNIQREGCELKFHLGKMRTAAWENRNSDSSRNYSTAVGKVGTYVILVKGESMQSSTYFFVKVCEVLWSCASHEKQLSSWIVEIFWIWGDTRSGLMKSVPEYLTTWRPVLPDFPKHRAPYFYSHPELLKEVLKVCSCSSS